MMQVVRPNTIPVQLGQVTSGKSPNVVNAFQTARANQQSFRSNQQRMQMNQQRMQMNDMAMADTQRKQAEEDKMRQLLQSAQGQDQIYQVLLKSNPQKALEFDQLRRQMSADELASAMDQVATLAQGAARLPPDQGEAMIKDAVSRNPVLQRTFPGGMNDPMLAGGIAANLPEPVKPETPKTQTISGYNNDGSGFTRVVNPLTGETISEFNTGTKPTEASAGPEFKDVQSLRKEYNTITKDFRTLDAQIRKVVNSSPNAAGDMALVFAFMKMLDPGSVVRESEYAAAARSRGVLEGLQATYAKLQAGESLSPEQRQRFKEEAIKVFKSQETHFNSLTDQYAGLAERYNIPVDDVIFNIPAPKLTSAFDNSGPSMDEVVSGDEQVNAITGPPQRTRASLSTQPQRTRAGLSTRPKKVGRFEVIAE